MKNALILHGTDNSSQNNWFLWLANELEKEGYKTFVPDLPGAKKPNTQRYNNFLFNEKKYEFNKESILIGHSSGSVAIFGILEHLPEDVIVDTCYLVGSFKDDLGWDSLKDLFLKPFDFKKIKGKARKFVFIHSDDDPHCPLSQAEFLHQQIGGELIVQPNQKHFSISTAGEKYKQFPFLLELVKNNGFWGMTYKFLKQYQLMAIATYGEHPWIANVYYAVDENMNIYFLSAESRLHSQHISKNKQVAVSVYDSTLTPVKKKSFSKIGVQIFGEAKLLEEKEEVVIALEKWKKALHVTNESFTYKNMQSGQIPGRMFKVSPKKLKLFDEMLFKENEVPLAEVN